MGVFNHFPYTNFHELNLNYILEQIGKYDNIISSFQAWQEESEADYAEILERVNALDLEMSTFQTDINNQFDTLEAQLTAQINALDAQTRATLTAAITEFRNEINSLIAETENEIAALKADVNAAILEVDGRMDANNQLIRDYVEYRLNKFIQDFPSIADLPVHNPVQGIVTDINTALRDLYDLGRSDGALTAFEYDSMGLTATNYDAHSLTAFFYDTRARWMLGFPDLRWSMISPFTGLWTMISTVVSQLADLHRNALTATQYDAKLLDATSYDALAITAYDYDWAGAALIP